jgi:glycerophosphoryl diester phosphodiesterase
MRIARTAFLCIALLSKVAFAAQLKPEVHGHRGARARFPENTLPALRYAAGVGVDYLEFDLGVTRDGVLVLSHEPRVNAEICAPSGNPLIHTLTLAELKKYDCGGTRNPKFPKQKLQPGTRIPTLDEVFTEFKASRVKFNIETKINPAQPDNTVSPAEFSKLVVQALQKYQLVTRTVLQSFDPRTLIEAKKLEPSLKTSLLVEDPKIDLLEAVKTYRPDIVSPDWHLLTAAKCKALHEAGVKIAPWTPNEPTQWKQLVEWGVDAIITDDPEALLSFLK